ncbi:cobalt-precorrin-6A reductase [Rhizobium grahamii]|uniref:Cobalt-precorrin-6x reductase n=2 Tax=Rhizobium grahamii TaxID=1120045 RepID=S3I697_9HYPH|nr:cobalt-precorrin-6A reductase [Rhizobium grahamii]EPE94993.1 cobalt-precorrin-6x reductase [Rhizobium grahamii CCGE 502]RDJ06933.1 precorrin-6A reductase [Rhizobium grahamii]
MEKARILILGGTGDARVLAQALAATGRYEILLSLAGRTQKPVCQPVPFRMGGFGGAEGLASFLGKGDFDLLIDATHPFATRMSINASQACKAAQIPALALRRPEWSEEPQDRWTHVASVADAIDALGPSPRRAFLAIGRQEAHLAEARPQHFYLVRSVDPVDPPLALPDVELILDRGPYVVENEIALLKAKRIDAVVTKNSGGSATYAKIAAARLLGIEVIMVRRAESADMQRLATVELILSAVGHLFPPSRKRGV